MSAAAGPTDLPAPPLRRRLACFVYEGVLLFGVVMAAGLVYGLATQQRHALVGQLGLQITLFLVLAVYFTTFWSRTGQTLAMKTWHIRVVTAAGAPLTPARAFVRYLLSWMWFLPALIGAHLAGLHSVGSVTGLLTAGVLAYAALAWLLPQRRYLHDLIAGTRLAQWRPPPARPA